MCCGGTAGGHPHKVCSFSLKSMGLVKRNLVIFLLYLSLPATGWSQPTLERFAYNNLEKGRWIKARTQLQKAVQKDSLNATARYVFSLYYFEPGNPDFNIDSAYTQCLLSLTDFQRTAVRQRERIKRFPLDSQIIVNLRMKIDSAAFQRAKSVNTEKSYIDFIARFPLASQVKLAAELRDEVAFIDALKENTYQSFFAYLTKYPSSVRAAEANTRYQKLLFETKTRDKKLDSFIDFLRQHPETPYCKEAERQVFEISTASGSKKSFEDFLRQYPNSPFAWRARNIVYYLWRELEETIPAWILTDSLRQIRALEQGYLVPFYRDGKLGFMNAHGKEVVAPFTDELSKDYLCGNVTEDVLVTREKIIARNGTVIFRGEIDEVEDMGYGFLAVHRKGCLTIVHKSGIEMVYPCLKDAAVVGGRMLAVKEKNTWRLTTLTGRQLMAGIDEVIDFGEVLGIKSANTVRLVRIDELAKAADQAEPAVTRAWDEARKFNEVIWVKTGEFETLLDDQLKELLPLQKQVITPTSFGALITSSQGTRIWQRGKPVSPLFTNIKLNEPLAAVQQNGYWHIFNIMNSSIAHKAFDSVYFIGPVLVGMVQDSLHIHYGPDHAIRLAANARLSFLPGKDSVFYIQAELASTKVLYNSRGQKLFTADFDRIHYLGDQFFVVVKNEKRGILSSLGKVIVPPEYDGMGNLYQGTLPVLKDKKFGMIDLYNRRQIKPEYERNLTRYNANYLVATKGGALGLISWANKPVLPFEYEEIRFWSDSTALLKKNFQWILFNFIEKKKIMDRIRDFRWIQDTEEEKILILHQDNYYGVIHNRKGIILPATYTDIINLGPATQPLYFTEKHVEEASIYVVIYYDANGKLLRRQVIEEDDYDTIYCSDN